MAPRKTTSSNKTRKKRAKSGKRKHKKPMKTWVRNCIAVGIGMLFVALFYAFFIRPFIYRWHIHHGGKQYGVVIPDGFEIHGIDISHYQGDIVWKKLDRCKDGKFPISFIFMKATEGASRSDHFFERNFEEARRHGFVRGAYHFYSTKSDPEKQADFFIKKVKLLPGDLPPVLDVESIGNMKLKPFQHDILLWLKKVESYYGVKPILYTSYNFKMTKLNEPEFDDFPYWIAHYYVGAVEYKGKWAFWQHSDVGVVPGIGENVDLNVFNGSKGDLDDLTIQQ